MAAPAHANATPIASPPELDFVVEGAHTVRYAAAPALGLDLRVGRADGGSVRSVALSAQIRIAATRRSYAPAEQARLVELFGLPEQWSQSVRSLLWTNATIQVPPFTGSTMCELQVPCTYDLEVAGARYFHALDGGVVPLELLFSGTVFYADEGGRLQVAAIAWDREAEYRLPVSVWRETMDIYFPDSAWLRLRRESFDRLSRYKAERALPSWDATLDSLLDGVGGP
jgi:Family of unknown function (DUF6084)